MKIAVIGTGYVGLVTAAGLAEFGHTVIGADKVADKIEQISPGRRPDLRARASTTSCATNLAEGNALLHAPTSTGRSGTADVIFVCVGTPQDDDGSADMSQIEEVSRIDRREPQRLQGRRREEHGPRQDLGLDQADITLYKKGDTHFDVASNPEFLREGSAVADFLEPDRIIVGVESDRARDMLVRIYEKFRDRILVTNIDTAELIKHASNSFLALKISYINLIANLCERTDADVEQVALGMGLDPRIGGALPQGRPRLRRLVLPQGHQGPDQDRRGPGRRHGPAQGDRPGQPRAGPRSSWTRSRSALWILKDKKIAVLGLAFKPETDDIREASSIKIIRELARGGRGPSGFTIPRPWTT